MAHTLSIDGIEIKYEPIKEKPAYKKYPKCDHEGNLLKRKRVTKGEYKTIYKEGEKKGKEYEGKEYRKVEGKARAKYSKTKQITKKEYKTAKKIEANDLATEKYYLVTQIPPALEEKIGEDKAIKWIHAFSGYKQYIAYLHRYKNKYIIQMGRIHLSNYLEDKKTKKAEIELEEEPEQVEKMTQQVEL